RRRAPRRTRQPDALPTAERFALSSPRRARRRALPSRACARVVLDSESMARCVRSTIAIGVLLLPACALKLSDKNEPLENGGVTGPAADCNTLQIVPKGAPGTGASDPKLIGRFDLTDPKNPTFD